MTSKRIAIVGGGPGGLMLARLLQLRGLKPVVLERDAHAAERPQGGSLDLHGETGQRAMREAGLQQAFYAAARPEDQGDRLYDPQGHLLYDRDGGDDDRPEIDRTVLRQILLDSLLPDTVRWNTRLADLSIDDAGTGAVLSGRGWRETFDVVVGADGGWSRVRPLVSDAQPGYEGVTLVELGFEVADHPQIAALTENGKMFAVGNNRAIITQKNGEGHIRGYAGARVQAATAREWAAAPEDTVREAMLREFAGWAPTLTAVVETGTLLGVRPLYALPIGHRWESRRGVTLLGDAAHLMSPFSGEGVNLALADAVDLADALGNSDDWSAVEIAEEAIAGRAVKAAAGASQGLKAAFSSEGVNPVLEHYLERTAA